VIISLLAVAGGGYSISVPQLYKIQYDISELTKETSKLGTDFRAFNESYHELLGKYRQIEGAYDALIKYFFVQDPGFTPPLDTNDWWEIESWHANPDSIAEIRDGSLHLFYNETTGNYYGNSGVFQGRHTRW